VFVGNEQGRPVSAPGLARWLERVAPARARGTVSLAIVSDERIRALNCQYRGRDYATDVLSFPVGTPVASAPCLGDIVIARGVARRQARRARHSERVELRVLALHGLLHLLGYDHERDQGRMQREERRLRRKGGLREGLIDRVQSAGPGATRKRSTALAEPVRGRATSR
jgi:probable rRNA maturation factor